MKKWIVALLSLLILCAASFALADVVVAIDDTHFPDASFRAFVNDHYGTNANLTTETVLKTTEMDCSNLQIGSIKGIEYFSSLKTLNCSRNNLTDLSSLSALKSLSVLNCSGNEDLTDLSPLSGLTALTDLDFNTDYHVSDSSFTQKLTNLVKFNCSNTDLHDLAGLTGMTKLQEFRSEYCDELGGLDFSYCTELTYLDCPYNDLGELDLSKCKKLTYLNCQWSHVSSLNVKNLTALKEIHSNNGDLSAVDFSGCSALTTFNVDQNRGITTMNLTGCSSLTSVSYDEEGNGYMLTSLDVTNCTGLKTLYCSGGQIQSIIVSGCTALEKLECPLCHLDDGIDVTGCPALKEFDCHWTNVPSLDLSKCPKMEKLSIYVCGIEDVDISHCPALCAAVQKYQRQSTSDYDYYGEADNPIILLSSSQTVSGAGEGFGGMNFSLVTIAAIADQEYTGKAVRPKLSVKMNGKALAEGTDYKAAFENNKAVGKATVTLTGIGRYTGVKTASFRIIPKKVNISSLKAGKKLLTVTWKAGSGIDGYEIEYGLKKSFKDAKKITVKKAKTTSYEIKKLKAKKTYYVRIRAYKKVKGKTYYSEWSKVLKKKVK